MKRIFKTLGIISIVLAVIFGVLTLLSLPDGGLMFALPYFFLLPAILFTVTGSVLILASRSKENVKKITK